ncbi:MAG: hypothetical protein ABEL97_15200 [Salinibacter sp.]
MVALVRLAVGTLVGLLGGGIPTAALHRVRTPYFDGPVRDRLAAADYEVTFRPYDWALNDQGRPRPRRASGSARTAAPEHFRVRPGT